MSSVRTGQPWIGVESDNLTGLAELSEKALLTSVRDRYERGSVYTNVGDILVAVNPFRRLPVYGEDWTQAYKRPDVGGLAPHVFRVAARAYNGLVQGKRDQVCVISGESGAGKTESTKLIIKQVMAMCRSVAGLGQHIQEKIMQLNPVLEAFGNARTALNDNSSRFGKFIQLIFHSNGQLVGAGLDQYLLEKSRVCTQGKQERNFHIFYLLYAGLGTEMLKRLHLTGPDKHNYLKSYSQVLADCSSEANRSAFGEMLENMRLLGFEQESIQQVLTVLAAVLILGDIEFVGEDGGNENAQVRSLEVVSLVTELLDMKEEQEDFAFSLTTLRTQTRGENVDRKYTCSKAADVRDAVAKALYARLFQWIVTKINRFLQPEFSNSHFSIGVLDIFGFENFDCNSFEQFCINLANEQLQQYFNHQIFAMEMMEYSREGLEVLNVTYNENKPALELFLNRPIGLLSLLDEQCRGLTGTDKSYVQRCKESFSKHPNFLPHKGNALVFTVRHYAGEIEYKVDGFLEKNKDQLPDTVLSTIKFAGMPLVRTLFSKNSVRQAMSQLKTSIRLKPSQKKSMRLMSRSRLHKSIRDPSRAGGGGGGGGGARPRRGGGGQRALMTVGAHFKSSLELLMERIFAASPHFVRCIKPNHLKVPNNFDDEFVLRQMRQTGMLEAVRVRREGFAYRPFFSDFFNDFRSISYYFTDKNCKANESSCQTILSAAGIDSWKMGKSRVFLRYYHEEKLLLLLKEMEDKATLIQKTFKGYMARKRVQPLKEIQQKEKRVVTEFIASIEQIGQEYFMKLKDLSKVDIHLAVERFGNYNKAVLEEKERRAMEESGGKKGFRPKAGMVAVLTNVAGEVPVPRKAVPKETSHPNTPVSSEHKPQKPLPMARRKKRDAGGNIVDISTSESSSTEGSRHKRPIGGVQLLPAQEQIKENVSSHRSSSEAQVLPSQEQVTAPSSHTNGKSTTVPQREVVSKNSSSEDLLKKKQGFSLTDAISASPTAALASKSEHYESLTELPDDAETPIANQYIHPELSRGVETAYSQESRPPVAAVTSEVSPQSSGSTISDGEAASVLSDEEEGEGGESTLDYFSVDRVTFLKATVLNTDDLSSDSSSEIFSPIRITSSHFKHASSLPDIIDGCDVSFGAQTTPTGNHCQYSPAALRPGRLFDPIRAMETSTPPIEEYDSYDGTDVTSKKRKSSSSPRLRSTSGKRGLFGILKRSTSDEKKLQRKGVTISSPSNTKGRHRNAKHKNNH